MVCFKCCSKSCVANVSKETILRKRNKHASLNSEESLSWLVDFIEENSIDGQTKWTVNCEVICAKAFSFVHGYSTKKMYQARQIVINGAVAPTGINRLGVERGKKKTSVRVWISVYCEFFGDYRPDKKEIHLPCHMTLVQ